MIFFRGDKMTAGYGGAEIIKKCSVDLNYPKITIQEFQTKQIIS